MTRLAYTSSSNGTAPELSNSGPPELEMKPLLRRVPTHPELGLIHSYLTTLMRWWPVVLGCAVVGCLTSFCLTLRVQPVYQARTSLDIQSINNDFLNIRNTAPTEDRGASSMESYVQTQIKLLQSTTVLDRTVDRLKSEPHLNAVDRGDTLSILKRAMHFSNGGDLPYAEMVNDAAKRVKVKPLGVTRLVEVTCDSWDPKFSALFCQTLTEEFTALDLETRGIEAHKTSEFLTKQLADVRQKAEESQRTLEAATGGNGLALSTEGNAIAGDRLRQLQGELVHAEADRMEKESLLKVALTSPSDSIPAALDSPIYRNYQQKLAELHSRLAEVVPPLTEENPKVIHLRAEIKDAEAGLQQARLATVERIRNDFESTRHHEDLLNASYAALESHVSGEMGRTERINLLRREVDSEQQLYQTLLQRAREAGFVSAMHTTAIRVVDAPMVPKATIAPRRGTAAFVGLILGSLSGLAFAFFRDRTANTFRAPGEAERLLNVQEVGVIPSGSADRRYVRQPSFVGLSRAFRYDKRKLALTNSASPLPYWSEKFSIVAEAYRNATHSILLSDSVRRSSRVYVVASPNSGEGKTTVTLNLGVALSKAKLRVVIVDGDLRKPDLHSKLVMENGFGMRNLLREEIDISTAPISEFCMPTTLPNLKLLTSGTGDEEVVELLHSGATNELINRLAKEFDVILIDTPPMLHMADARILAANSDGIILVLRAGVTRHDHAMSTCDLIDGDRVPLIGTILNDFDPKREGNKGYYQSYYRYSESARGVGLPL